MLLKFAIQEFLDDREFKKVSQRTLETYKLILNHFLGYCNENEIINVEDITPIIVKNYILTQHGKEEQVHCPTSIIQTQK